MCVHDEKWLFWFLMNMRTIVLYYVRKSTFLFAGGGLKRAYGMYCEEIEYVVCDYGDLGDNERIVVHSFIFKNYAFASHALAYSGPD